MDSLTVSDCQSAGGNLFGAEVKPNSNGSLLLVPWTGKIDGSGASNTTLSVKKMPFCSFFDGKKKRK